ncbi:MAG: S8 family serine peptidase [Phycisphaerales bacterium]|nr:S8 family serine peptidase [Phycisphaerales bacterium]
MSTKQILGAVGLSMTVPALLAMGPEVGPDLDQSPNVYSAVPDATALDHEYKPRSLMIRFKTSASAEARQALLDQVGAKVTTRYNLVPDLVAVDIDSSVAEALAVIGNRTDVLQYVEPNFIYRTFATPNDPLYSTLYGMPAINAPQAWDDHVGDPDFAIAIIDTGIDYNHQDLAANMWINTGEIAGNGQDDDGNGYVDDVYGYDFVSNEGDPMDGNSHGTHCGGTVGGVGNNGVGVVGVVWQCKLAGVQFLSSGGSGSLDDAVSAIQYCEVMDFKVSNNSWGGGGFSQSMLDGINAAGNQDGHIFCAAAGNSGSYGASYPAAYDSPYVISVAATDSNDNLAGFSQYHPVEVDLGAPGVDVNSCTPGNGYSYYSGTSMATPHVAGGVALIYSLMGDASAAEVKALIMDHVRPVGALSGNCVSGGILDVEAAVANTFLGPQLALNSSVPDSMDPGMVSSWSLNVNPREDVLIQGSVVMKYRFGAGAYQTIQMSNEGLFNYVADMPGASCDEAPEFYFQVEGQTAGVVTYPSGGPTNPLNFFIGEMVVSMSDDFNSDMGWTVTGDALDGAWERGIPVAGCDRGNPGSDYDGSGLCFVTDNSSANDCNSDVDDGTTILTSPVFDASGSGDLSVSYARWHSNNFGAAPGTDPMIVDISNNGGVSWVNLETVGPTGEGTTGGWNKVSFIVSDYLAPTNQMRIRFTVSDLGADTQSVVESGVDAFSVEYIECDPGTPCPADLNGDGLVDVNDLLEIIAQFGQAGSGDIDGDGAVDTDDILSAIAAWGVC